jgi:hypothetical protein
MEVTNSKSWSKRMARRKEPGLFDMLMEMPWWVGVIVAAIAYVLIAAVVPRMLADNAILKSFVGICPTAAKMVALLCLVAAGVSAI